MMAADKGVVEEWLSEFKTLPEISISSYASSLKGKSTLVSELYTVISESLSELLEPVCHQLFEFYRSGEFELKRFTLQFVPELVSSYLSVISARNMHSSGCIEALLLGIYNLEIVDKEGGTKVLSFTVPSLSKPSVYHEPSSFGSMALTEGALSRHGLTRVVHAGPYCQRETFTAQNRFEVLTFLLLCYNAAIVYVPCHSLQSLCRMCSRICVNGFPRKLQKKSENIRSRIRVSPEFMVHMLTAVYYAIYNGEWELGCKALDDVLYRAQLEMFPEPLLVGNAIKNTLPSSALKSSKNAPRSIQVEITPTSSRISRNAVTSLSIRGHRWKRNETTDLKDQEDLVNIIEGDEKSYSKALNAVMVNTNNKVSAGNCQWQSLNNKAGKEIAGETCREHLARKHQSQRAVSENLDLLSMKRLTLTNSQSVPKAGSQSLANTSTTLFSKSFEQVSGVYTGNSPARATSRNTTESNRFSACSLQEDRRVSDRELQTTVSKTEATMLTKF
ncbi:hyccin isoform X1 [Leucoraja erinacea]|uniref:hyccin isoform X1 n=1 Tax=Leucoraja erinaceus TaxID=7782 RepID=UPI002454B29C|nr:hyccin isoform X1 [Leucoraja erinacea]XP_055517246.1 hyccin isoform X1 [Leucoraja erinacea]XP_055517255.1 hyccin isoform X1 [Leucoraja erinacea]XP_055517263.1 hyccin isoform X1 [Leucoraja erinacea]